MGTLQECKIQLDAYLQIYASILQAAKQNHVASDAEEKSVIVLRLLYAKTKVIRKLLDGINYNYVSEDSVELIVEPTSLFVQIRSILELVYVYEYVYLKPDTPEKKEFAYQLYLHTGLKERLSMEFKTPEVMEQLRKTEEKAREAREKILNSAYYQGLSEASKKDIQKRLNDKHPVYRLLFEDHEVKSVSYEEACRGIGFESDFFKETYAFLSTHTHPTYLTLVQFRDAYIGVEMGPLYEGFASLASLFLLSMLSILIEDARQQVPYIETVYNGLEDSIKNQMNELIQVTKANHTEEINQTNS